MKKNILKFLPLVAMALMAFTFVACGDDDDDNNNGGSTSQEVRGQVTLVTAGQFCEYVEGTIKITGPDGTKSEATIKDGTNTVYVPIKNYPAECKVEVNLTKKKSIPEDAKPSLGYGFGRGFYKSGSLNTSVSANLVSGVKDATLDKMITNLNAKTGTMSITSFSEAQ